MKICLVVALYIIHSTGAHEDLTKQELKTLKTEFFLQQFAEQIKTAPRKLIKTTSLAEVIENIKKTKNRAKRAAPKQTTNSCLFERKFNLKNNLVILSDL